MPRRRPCFPRGRFSFQFKNPPLKKINHFRTDFINKVLCKRNVIIIDQPLILPVPHRLMDEARKRLGHFSIHI